MTDPTVDSATPEPQDPSQQDDAQQDDAQQDDAQQDDAFLRLLGWPPPGLARIQGDLWTLVRKMMLAGAILVLPLLFVITVSQPQPGLGPLGESWWIVVLTTMFGLLLFADASVELVRVIRRAHRARQEGYSAHVVGLVLSDSDRDAGFLLQGAQLYSVASESNRHNMARLRLWEPLAYLAAALWLIVGFSVLVLLAARGVASAGTIAMGSLVPPGILLLVGLVLRGAAGTLATRARKAWFKQPWAKDLTHRDASEWREAAAKRGASSEGASPGGVWSLRLALGAVLVGALLAVLPPVTLVPVSSIGAILTSISGYGIQRVQERTVQAEPYRSFRLPEDSSISAEEAGEILNTLLYVGRPETVSEGGRAPSQTYEDSFIPESPAEQWPATNPSFWTDSLWASAERGLSSTERDFLTQVAAHPAHGEFARLARAGSADVIGGGYVTPFPEDWVYWNMPIPRYTVIREAAYTHLGIAVLRASQGRYAEAEEAVREVISVGFVMMDESPTLIGHMVGGAIASTGGRALEHALRLSGQEARADVLAATVSAMERAVSIVMSGRQEAVSGQAFLESLPPLAADPQTQRALRWEALQFVSSITPCLNLQRAVFGPDEAHTRWVEQLRSSLVRFPSEAALFELTLRGIAVGGDPSLLSRLFSVSTGGRGKQGSCADFLVHLPMIM